MKCHEREYEQTKGSYSRYLSRYQAGGVGHYNRLGNHFFAYSVKSKFAEMLEPRPSPCRDEDAEAIDFRGYMPGT